MNRHTIVAALIAIAMFTIGLFSGASLQHDLDVQGFRSIDVHIIAPDPADDDTPNAQRKREESMICRCKECVAKRLVRMLIDLDWFFVQKKESIQ